MVTFATSFVLSEVRLEMGDAATEPDRHSLSAVICSELFHDVLNVDFDSFLRNKQLFCNIAIPIFSRNFL